MTSLMVDSGYDHWRVLTSNSYCLKLISCFPATSSPLKILSLGVLPIYVGFGGSSLVGGCNLGSPGHILGP